MKKEQVLTTTLSEMEQKHWDNAEKNLSEDFKFEGGTSQPMGKKEWIQVHRALQSGMPDLKFNLQDVIPKSEDKLAAKVKVTGTHTSMLPPVLQGSEPLEATGKKVELPKEEVEVTFSGDKISRVYVYPVEHGGVPGIIEQLTARK